jgi:hypothetical protein
LPKKVIKNETIHYITKHIIVVSGFTGAQVRTKKVRQIGL